MGTFLDPETFSIIHTQKIQIMKDKISCQKRVRSLFHGQQDCNILPPAPIPLLFHGYNYLQLFVVIFIGQLGPGSALNSGACASRFVLSVSWATTSTHLKWACTLHKKMFINQKNMLVTPLGITPFNDVFIWPYNVCRVTKKLLSSDPLTMCHYLPFIRKSELSIGAFYDILNTAGNVM